MKENIIVLLIAGIAMLMATGIAHIPDEPMVPIPNEPLAPIPNEPMPCDNYLGPCPDTPEVPINPDTPEVPVTPNTTEVLVTPVPYIPTTPIPTPATPEVLVFDVK